MVTQRTMGTQSRRWARIRGQEDRIPARARPFVRLALLALMVLVVDVATGRLTPEGGFLSFPTASVVRVLSGLVLLRYPLAGFLLVLEVDKWDWWWLGMPDRSDADAAFYQQWDKVLDLVISVITLAVVYRWQDARARLLAYGAFAWRVIGVAAFLATDQRWLLIVFPNVFESVFLFYILFRTITGRDEMLDSGRAAAVFAAALTVPKLVQEYFLHALGERPWDLMELTSSRPLDITLWAAMLYGLPVIALGGLIATVEGPKVIEDPEVEWDETAPKEPG